MKTETCPECKAEYDAAYKHSCRDTKCAFCRKEVDPLVWCISFGNSPLLGKEYVDQVCPDCIIDGFRELEDWRKRPNFGPHPFECPGCPECPGVMP